MPFRLIVGLGNPGREYKETRHNVGFMVLDAITSLESVSFGEEERGPAALCKIGETRFLKPLTYMNESGVAVRVWLDWLKLSISDLLVIVDDLALPLGQLRFRVGGSHGGHNGLLSIERELGTEAYARLRCGIGPLPVGRELKEFVLGRFGKDEEEKEREMIRAATTAIQCCQQEGIEIAMQGFNVKLKEKSEEKK